jgi:uncharacterized membrane protein
MPTFYSWTPVVVLHTVFAALSILIGAALLWRRKGTRVHRIGGWVWVLCMSVVAGISFSIYRPDGFSWIPGLSICTLGALVVGVWFARSHRMRAHRFHMIALYLGALVITGLFTLLPGRLIGSLLWGGLGIL